LSLAAPTITDWISVGLTVVLVVTTVAYVRLTHRMAQAMETQSTEYRSALRREKSDHAAYACLDGLRQLEAEMDRRGPSAVDPATIREARHTLEGHLPMVCDEVVRDRLRATAEVLFVAGLSTEQLAKDQLAPSRIARGTRNIVRAMVLVLQDLLAENPTRESPWRRSNEDCCGDHYPTASTAAAWIRCVGRADEAS
jgi:hypothetical protein